MIRVGLILFGVYMIPFSPDSTLLLALALILFGTIRRYMAHGAEVNHASSAP